MSDELKQAASTQHTLLVARYYRDGLSLAAAQRQMVVAHADFERVAERRGLDDADGRSGHDAHLHQAARDRALATHGEHARARADAQAVERRGCRVGAFGPFCDYVLQVEGNVGGTHKAFTDDFRIKRTRLRRSSRQPLTAIYRS